MLLACPSETGLEMQGSGPCCLPPSPLPPVQEVTCSPLERFLQFFCNAGRKCTYLLGSVFPFRFLEKTIVQALFHFY